MSATDAPPSYDKALGQPANANAAAGGGGANLSRTHSNSSEGGDPFEGMSPEERREMADEYRELPEGWVKCWDPKYVRRRHRLGLSCTLPETSLSHHPADTM